LVHAWFLLALVSEKYIKRVTAMIRASLATWARNRFWYLTDGLQADLTHLSLKGRQIVLENSGHGIMMDAPKDVWRG
jgi:hypothetical protein